MLNSLVKGLRTVGAIGIVSAALLVPAAAANAETASVDPAPKAQSVGAVADESKIKTLKPAPVPKEIRNKTKGTPECGTFPSGSLICVAAAPGEPVTVWYDNKAASQPIRLGMKSSSESGPRWGDKVIAPVNQVTGAQWTGLANGCYTGLIHLINEGPNGGWKTPEDVCVR